MQAPASVVGLVERFDQNREAYRSGAYNETQVRLEFINPMFEALGWDISNRQGYAEAYKDVVHEDSLRIADGVKAPDYCFRVGGRRAFFLEAKKPSVNLRDAGSPAFQLRRYAWSAKLPVSILTDFEEFAAYDCRVKPAKTDRPSASRVRYLTYRDYLDDWESIAAVFSREAVLKGSFDAFAESNRAKRGTAEVDAEFLKEIDSWREVLARNFALRNPALTPRQLNFAVQRTIDRIVFLRMCEDRGIEEYGQLRTLADCEGAYQRLCELYQRADERYNSGLFYFEMEHGRVESPDELTPQLLLDDRPLKEILRGLYYPDSPYEFSVLPPEILGQVYEQFLGKVIRLTAGHRAVIEEKPEVKKAGGVYYTPSYIVDFIVQETVGRAVQNRSPRQVSAFKILDPACGSGSFLLGAYAFLLDWHRDWYVEHGPEKYPKQIYRAHGGAWHLSTPEKKRILLNNIYGVDIDAQAVEVTKLSLLLKVLEGDSRETLETQRRLFHERALPDLGPNIKCGNSLISPDVYRERQMRLLDDEESYRINAFDWHTEFAAVFRHTDPGFDAVIGNPPYGAALLPVESEYLARTYAATAGDLDTYSLFMAKATEITKPGGLISMIVPSGWYSATKSASLRRFLACATDPVAFINLPYDVFRAWVDTTIFVARKRQEPLVWPRREGAPASLRTFPKRHRIRSSVEFRENCRSVDVAQWFRDGHDEYLTYADASVAPLLAKLQRAGVPLGQLADVQRGVTPFNVTDHPAFLTSRPAFKGTVRRYTFEPGPRCFIRFDETLAELKPERYFEGPRLLLRELISRQFRLQAVKVTEPFVTNKSMQSILGSPGGPSLSYLLGLLNSRLLSWYFLCRSQIAQRDDFPKIVLRETRALPIVSTDDRGIHDQVVELVDEILRLQRRRKESRTPGEQSRLDRQISQADIEIDQLVYRLYELDSAEVGIVEAPASAK